ncbi:EF-hand domain-containing protein [Magnetospirillum sulfuroxidans]|uniref:EF-hand domain-containing protein n=1 Tax=Magnetospirillum sulfuroxidans TaxID=611300 RepID=A0ABS5IDJ0_9PROT|nr:EF-hand domain-containing protein [Magnetospirillum sulfuroxidans]MBR9972485.1 EF-hand domain-containing protein [Magnetospirillum sulfuroxidans]
MTSALGGLGSFSSAQFQKMFTKIDTNADGKVSKDEFVAGAPDDVSAEKAASLFDKLDSESTGALSQSDLASAFQQMAASMQASMIQVQAANSNQNDPPDAEDLFAKLDSDGDGAVSREEFVAGRPDDVSEEQASAFFDKIAGEDAESVDQETFVAGMQPPPPPGGGGGGGGGGGDSDETFDALDTNKDGVVSRQEFLAGRPDDVSEEQAASLFESLAGENADSITAEQFAAGMQGPPPPPSSEMAGMSSDDQDLVEKLMAALEQGTSSSSDGSSSSSALQQLISAIDAYTKSQQSSATQSSSNAVAALSLSA